MTVMPSDDSTPTARVVGLQRDLMAVAPASADAWIHSLDLLLHRLYMQGNELGQKPDWRTLQIRFEPEAETNRIKVTASVEVF